MTQTKILEQIKKIVKSNLILEPEISISDYFFFTSWSDSYGKWNLNKILKKRINFFENLNYLIKYAIIYSIADLEKYKLTYSKKKNKSQNLIISYTNNYKLLKNYDNYFSCVIKKSNKTRWFLINLDRFKRIKNLPYNLTVLSKQKNYFYFNLKFYLNIFKFIFFILFFKKKIYDDKFFDTLKSGILQILKKSNFSKIYIPYESQPHQHQIIKIIKSFDKKIKIIGYLHSSLTPLPTDFIYKKKYEPDILIVHGLAQKEILVKHLGWQSKNIRNLKSFRYTKKSKSFFTNKLFLPFSLNKPDKLKFNMKNFLELYSIKINQFNIVNHPLMLNSTKHKNFINEIKNIQTLKKNSKNQIKNISIVVGVSAIILEMLENNIEVIHICSEPIFEKHSSEIWKNIIVKELVKGVYSYKIKKVKSLINFGKKNEFQNKCKIY